MNVWSLFPLSTANRRLREDAMMDESWAAKLNDIFGDTGWFEEFYRPDPLLSFLEEDNERFIKNTNTDEVSNTRAEKLAMRGARPY